MRKLKWLAAAAVAAAPLLAGCGSGTGGAVVLSFYTPADGSQQYAAAAANCTKAAAGRYRIAQQTLPRNADDQRLQLARRLAGNDHTLDLMALDVVWTAEFAEAGWALPLPDDVAARVSRGTLAGPLATAMWQHRLFAAPLNSNTELLWYRKDLMPGGHPPQTWDQLLDIARGLVAAHRPAGIEVQAKQYEGLMVWFNTMLASAGGSIVGPDGATVTLDRGGAARTALELMKRVATAPGHDPSFDQLDESLARSSMEDGHAAFELNWPFVLPGIKTDAAAGGVASIDGDGNPISAHTGNTVLTVNGQQNFLPAPFPAVVAGNPAKVTIGGFNVAVAKTSRHSDLAFQAMECLRDSENERSDGIDGGLPPTLSALYDDPAFQAAYPMWRQVRDGLSTAAVRPASPAYQSISTLLTAKLNPVGDIDPDTAVPMLAQQVRNAVDSKGLVP